MAINKNNDFTLTHYLNLAAQRSTLLDQVPFFLGLKNNPPVIRRILEALFLAVNWTVSDVANGATHTVGVDDVVILSGYSATIVLPVISVGSPGRVLVIKDSSGLAGETGKAIAVNRSSPDTIDGSNITFSLAANYGAVVFVSGNGSVWHAIALV